MDSKQGSSESSEVEGVSVKGDNLNIELKNVDKDSSSESDDSTDDDSAVFHPHLDIFSSEFDPAAAIYSSELALPNPSAPVHDNVEAFVAKIQVNFPKYYFSTYCLWLISML